MTIFDVSEEKKWEYWNHFVAAAFTGVTSKPHGITGPRLRKLRHKIWQDRDFWWDIVLRHGGDKYTPEQMRLDDPRQYEHALGNFWGGIVQDLVETGVPM